MLETIIDYRNYAAAKAVYDVNPKASGEMVQTVKETEFALAQEAIDRG